MELSAYIDKGGHLPTSDGMSWELYAASSDILYETGGRSYIKTKVTIYIPLGMVGIIQSCLIEHGVDVLNRIVTGETELNIFLINHSRSEFRVKEGMKIAKFIICGGRETVNLALFENLDDIRRTTPQGIKKILD
jgi:dUTPase